MQKLTMLFADMIKQIDRNMKAGEDLVSLFPLKGKYYNGELMVIGRAVNGWEETKWTSGQLKSRRSR